MAPIALICPRFSATRMIATGAIRLIACAVKTGLVKFGRPNQAACATFEKSIGLTEAHAIREDEVDDIGDRPADAGSAAAATCRAHRPRQARPRAP